MHGEILLVVFILTLGCGAFCFCVIYLACRFLAFLGRGIAGMFGHRPAAQRLPAALGRTQLRVCPQEQCRKVEQRPALFCSQCGARLSDAPKSGSP